MVVVLVMAFVVPEKKRSTYFTPRHRKHMVRRRRFTTRTGDRESSLLGRRLQSNAVRTETEVR